MNHGNALKEDGPDRIELLRACAPFALAGDPVLSRLADAAEWISLTAGEGLEIDDGAVLAVADGRLRVITSGRFHDIDAGDVLFLDEAAAGRNVPAAAGTALSLALAALIPSSALLSEVDGVDGFGGQLARYFARRLTAAGGAAASPSHKLYAQLVMLAQPNGGDGCWRIERMPRHRELAGEAGLSEEAAADAIAHLISTGVARRNYPGMDILKYDSLRRLASV